MCEHFETNLYPWIVESSGEVRPVGLHESNDIERSVPGPITSPYKVDRAPYLR